ncbi:MAG TPA: FadR/GntR family transcriptional regulator [Anaeromyxobacteraceae bacterium]|nr:FadR/GntR family transcriptional regulator [Anaeromyxobacteraceae bacterium]
MDDKHTPLEPTADPFPRAPGAARAYENILTHIHQQVEDGVLKPGDKLPSERKLAELFGVGRSSVRDAIRILEVRGIVKPRQGGGTVVQALTSDALVAELASVLVRKRALVQELMDVRCMIEPPLAARAAAHATPEQIEHLEAILRRQGAKVKRGEMAVEEDTEFHSAIAEAAANRVMLAVLDTLVGLLTETRKHTLHPGVRARSSLAAHRLVLRAIRRREPGAAEAAMRKHIRAVEGIIHRHEMVALKR